MCVSILASIHTNWINVFPVPELTGLVSKYDMNLVDGTMHIRSSQIPFTDLVTVKSAVTQRHTPGEDRKETGGFWPFWVLALMGKFVPDFHFTI